MSAKRKVTLFSTLADPKNREVAQKFFKFTFLMIFLPIGFMLASMKSRILSVEVSAIIAVVMVNVIMGFYAFAAYKEEVVETRPPENPTKKND